MYSSVINKKIRRRRATFKRKRVPVIREKVAASRRVFFCATLSFFECDEQSYKRKKLQEHFLVLDRWLPVNLHYLLFDTTGQFCYNSLKKEKNLGNNGVINIPNCFSIIYNPEQSFYTLRSILHALYFEHNDMVTFDYIHCNSIGIETQAIMDVFLKEHSTFIKRSRHNVDFPQKFEGININNEDIQKILFTIGSPATLELTNARFTDVQRCKMRMHSMKKNGRYLDMMKAKDIDTTELADYVISCMATVHKTLTSDAIDQLCTVIGEILINAEEHSSTKNRISVGYFREHNEDGRHYGVFRLSIINFGRSIYEKFKNGDCENLAVVEKMRALSKTYTEHGFFSSKETFNEGDLWTLYALQDGVTSVIGQRRGSGSVRFIDSFFNLKGDNNVDNESEMNIISGNTRIRFDGTYRISKSERNGEVYSVMSFNNSGSLEERPDSTFVGYYSPYFPGTVISVKIKLDDNDIIN